MEFAHRLIMSEGESLSNLLLRTVLSKVTWLMAEVAVVVLLILLALWVSEKPTITQRRQGVYSWLGCEGSKCDSFEGFDLLDRSSYGVFSILDCSSSTLFIVQVYEVGLHD